MPRKIPQLCAPRKRCRDYRNCPACAAIRQARIADQAEAILRDYLQLQLIVLRPHNATQPGMRAAIRAAIRNNGLRAGIWTVELGQKAGTLHANILTHDGPIKQTNSATTHAEPVRTNARAVAAYISKRSQHPDREIYDGRTYGAWGRMADILVAEDMPPIVTGATLERTLTPAAERQTPPPPPRQPAPATPLTREEYRVIANRHLPRLLAAARGETS